MHSNGSSPDRTRFSRRFLMGAAGATALGAAVGAQAGAVAADSWDSDDAPLGGGRSRAASIGAQSVPAPTPGLTYMGFGPFEFSAVVAGGVRDIGPLGAKLTPNGLLATGLVFTNGCHLREITLSVLNPTAVSVTAVLNAYSLDGSAAPLALIEIPPGGPAIAPLTTALDHTVTADLTYYLAVVVADPAIEVLGGRVGFEPAPIPAPPAPYVAIDPYRAYDSRRGAGPMTPNSSRQISVLAAAVGAGSIPATAKAITYNVTATGTSGGNYLSVTPGNATGYTVSTLNFSDGIDIANGGTVRLDAGAVKVFCGDQAGSAHVIIDVTGYYV